MTGSKRSSGRSTFVTILIAIGILFALIRVGTRVARVIQKSDAKTSMEKAQREGFTQGEKMLIGSLDHTKWLKRIEQNGRVYGIELLIKGGQKGVRTVFYPNPSGTSYCQLKQEFIASIDQETLKKTKEVILDLDFEDDFIWDEACTEGTTQEQSFLSQEAEKSARLALAGSLTSGGILSIKDFIRVDYEHDFVKAALNIVKKEYLAFKNKDAIKLRKSLKDGQLQLNQNCNIRINKLSGVLSLITEKNETLYIGKYNKLAEDSYLFTSKAWLTNPDCDCERLGVLQDVAFLSAVGLEAKSDLEIVFEKGKARIPAIRVLPD